MINIAFRCEKKWLSKFNFLLNQGFKIEIEGEHSIRDLYDRQLGLDPGYLEKGIQTLFLNSKPVDDVDTAMVCPGSTLAFSAAMPGVLGATMRKKGFFAAMRSQISYRAQASQTGSVNRGEMVLKLLNRVAVDLGPVFFQRGIVVRGPNFKRCLNLLPDDLSAGALSAEMNGENIPVKDLLGMEWNGVDVFVKIDVEKCD